MDDITWFLTRHNLPVILFCADEDVRAEVARRAETEIPPGWSAVQACVLDEYGTDTDRKLLAAFSVAWNKNLLPEKKAMYLSMVGRL